MNSAGSACRTLRHRPKRVADQLTNNGRKPYRREDQRWLILCLGKSAERGKQYTDAALAAISLSNFVQCFMSQECYLGQPGQAFTVFS